MLRKLWLETRVVFVSVAAFLLSMVALYAWLPAGPVEWDARLHRLFFAFALAAVLLSLHALSWMHGNFSGQAQPMLFALSLPLSRRRLVAWEAAMIAAQSLALLLSCCTLLWTASPSLRATREPEQMLGYLAVALGGQALLYSVGILLATASPVLWCLYCFAAVSAFQWQLSMLQAWGGIGVWVRETGRLVLPFATAHLVVMPAACIGLGAAALLATARVFERRDF